MIMIDSGGIVHYIDPRNVYIRNVDHYLIDSWMFRYEMLIRPKQYRYISGNTTQARK